MNKDKLHMCFFTMFCFALCLSFLNVQAVSASQSALAANNTLNIEIGTVDLSQNETLRFSLIWTGQKPNAGASCREQYDNGERVAPAAESTMECGSIEQVFTFKNSIVPADAPIKGVTVLFTNAFFSLPLDGQYQAAPPESGKVWNSKTISLFGISFLGNYVGEASTLQYYASSAFTKNKYTITLNQFDKRFGQAAFDLYEETEYINPTLSPFPVKAGTTPQEGIYHLVYSDGKFVKMAGPGFIEDEIDAPEEMVSGKRILQIFNDPLFYNEFSLIADAKSEAVELDLEKPLFLIEYEDAQGLTGFWSSAAQNQMRVIFSISNTQL